MLRFKYWPPRSSEDVELSPGAILLITGCSSDSFSRTMLHNLGDAIGSVLYTSMVTPPNINPELGNIIRKIGREMIAEWERDDVDEVDEKFHRGLNMGIQREHAELVYKLTGEVLCERDVDYI